MKNQKGFIVPVLIAIIAVLVIGGGIYIYTTNKKSDKEKLKEQIAIECSKGGDGPKEISQKCSELLAEERQKYPEEFPSGVNNVSEINTQPSIQPVDISNWKTYTSIKYGFTFQYPEELELFDNLDSHVYGTTVAISILNGEADGSGYSAMDISVMANPKHLSAEEFIKQIIEEEKKCEEVCGWFSDFEAENKIDLGDNIFYGIVGGFTGEVPRTDIYYLSKGNNFFEFHIANFNGTHYTQQINMSKKMYQVLSTFKFTN